MIDRSDYVCHRMKAAQAGVGGGVFRPSDEPPLWFRALAEVFRPRSLIILAAMAGVIALWFL
jgi:hypothetical protein